jgi:hypothetical protein
VGGGPRDAWGGGGPKTSTSRTPSQGQTAAVPGTVVVPPAEPRKGCPGTPRPDRPTVPAPRPCAYGPPGTSPVDSRSLLTHNARRRTGRLVRAYLESRRLCRIRMSTRSSDMAVARRAHRSRYRCRRGNWSSRAQPADLAPRVSLTQMFMPRTILTLPVCGQSAYRRISMPSGSRSPTSTAPPR